MLIKPCKEFIDLTEKLRPWKERNEDGDLVLKPNAPKEIISDFDRWKKLKEKTFYSFA